MAKKIEQPSVEEQRMLKEVTAAEPGEVIVRGKKWRVDWTRNEALDKVSQILLESNKYDYDKEPVKSGAEENKVVCKCAAVLRLNTLWKIKLLYWFVWRWFYYVKNYNEVDLCDYIEESKKKVPVLSYLKSITLLTAMMDTRKQMNRAEVNRIQAEQLSAQRAALEKTTRN